MEIPDLFASFPVQFSSGLTFLSSSVADPHPNFSSYGFGTRGEKNENKSLVVLLIKM